MLPEQRNLYLTVKNKSSIDFSNTYSKLSSDDILRFNQIKNKKRRDAFLAGRHLLISGLKKLTDNKLYRLKVNKKGKPSLLNSDWEFNISHSKDFVSIAFFKKSYGHIGLDIEVFRDRDYSNIIKRYFYKEERDFINSLEKSISEKVFLSLWSIKEAQIKALGESVLKIEKMPSISISYLKEVTKNLNSLNKEGKYNLNYINNIPSFNYKFSEKNFFLKNYPLFKGDSSITISISTEKEFNIILF